ncbi:MAG: TonB-dependent receptor [Gammaproteobacteria bacterium]|nr:TonB-dependent receptor [Gammaproteobacteria bacterium]
MRTRYKSYLSRLASPIVSLALISLAPAALAADSGPELEEVVVTGSIIRGTPIDSATNVSVFTRESLNLQNTPSIVDFTKNLSFSSGVDGDSNQFQSNATEGTANVNLRGLGAPRSLVLINGMRQVAVPVRLPAGRFVDINNIPSAAIERIEILKEGAAATYGSDAIGGVVNFITRKNFQGFEIQAGFTDIEDSDGDANLSAIFGTRIGNFDWVTSVGYFTRSELHQRDRGWSANTDGSAFPFGGYSSIGNPGTFYPFLDTNPDGDGLGIDTILSGAIADPGCEDVGSIIRDNVCRFQYTQFDNLVEDEEHWQIFSEINGEIGNGNNLHVEFLYADTEVPHWATSPSYPPQLLIDPVQKITPDHPGWDGFFVDTFPEIIAALPLEPDYFILRGRVSGAGAAGPRTGFRDYETWRLAAKLDGALTEEIDYRISFSYSHSEGGFQSQDASIAKTKLAFNGFGGEGCGAVLDNDENIITNGAVPGQGSCEWFSPFSTAIQAGYWGQFVNPNFDPSQENSQALLDWIDDDWDQFGENELITLEVVFQQSVDNIDVAYGVQVRYNEVEQDPGDLNNTAINPCRVPGFFDCVNKTGLHSFLGSSTAYNLDQTVYAGFAEAAIELGDNVAVQVGVRYENYGSENETFDPKLSIQYHITDNLSFRGSVQTTFRGPTPNDLSTGSATALSFVLQTLAFKAIDTVGNPDVVPEEAFTYNFGLVYSGDNLNASIDYWAFDFENPIIVESFGQLVAAYAAGGTAKEAVQGQITCQGGLRDGSCTAAGIERIQANIVNGPRTETAGVDIFANYTMELAGAEVSLGLEGTYTLRYDVDAYILNGVKVADAFEAAGFYNFENGVRPIQDLKLRAHVNVAFLGGRHNVLTYVNYVSDYDDRRAAVVPFNGGTIDSQTTVDIHYTANLMDDALSVTLSAINATDEEPPVAYGDLMYDAYTHNALGRMFKLGFRYGF